MHETPCGIITQAFTIIAYQRAGCPGTHLGYKPPDEKNTTFDPKAHIPETMCA